MKLLKYIFLIFLLIMVSCKDEPLIEEPNNNPEFNIEEFSDGYSLAFDLDLDIMGGEIATRAVDDITLQEWENFLDPEEFRVLFFDIQDRFLFESKSRWLTQIESHSGGNRWRVGIPVFQYLGDNYDDTPGHEGEPLDTLDRYNWNKIADIMRTEGFKIAVLANRPLKITLPKLSDFAGEFAYLENMDFAKLGPFWTSKNSIATDGIDNSDVATVFDLHHCQFDPVYFSKSIGSGATDVYGQRYYDFIMDYNNHNEEIAGTGKTLENAPWMGAASSWVSLKRTRYQNIDSRERTVRYYRLPKDQVVRNAHNESGDSGSLDPEADQYIPMYGIQQFAPLTTWVKGTTFNLSEQTGSQTGDYDYSSISLLRSVVKIELRIPMYDNNGQYVDVDNKWAQIWFNNYMARCEPMDVSTPTNKIWEKDHENDCEWLRIKQYGNFTKYSDFKNWLSWYYGNWVESGAWNFSEHTSDNITLPEKVAFKGKEADYPHIFNPMTQRLQCALISDCYLPTDDFHRWVIYCGERNIADPSTLGTMTGPTVTCFRIPVTRKEIEYQAGNYVRYKDVDYIYNFPITDYSRTNDNPIYSAWTNTKDTNNKGTHLVETGGKKDDIVNPPQNIQDYGNDLTGKGADLQPFPLLRNHFYRIEVSFGDNYDINVKVLNADIRNVGGIVFN